MGLYSFKKQFVPYVENGTKTHTIRGKRRHPDRPGSTFYGYYAVRSKHCRKLIEAPITRVEDTVIDPRCREIWIAETKLNADECDLFAFRDGFRLDVVPCGGEFEVMLAFWRKDNKAFTRWNGDTVHWDYDRRVKLTGKHV